MPLTTVVLILNIVNGLLTAAKDLPAVRQEAQSLLEKIAIHIPAAGKDPQAAFIAAKQRLTNGLQSLIDPATGQTLRG
jgi:hypothetical protein